MRFVIGDLGLIWAGPATARMVNAGSTSAYNRRMAARRIIEPIEPMTQHAREQRAVAGNAATGRS
jgi:PPE-repeat protein